MAAPRILVIIVVDGKEIVKKAIRAKTIQEVQQESEKVCPQILSLYRERVLVYDKAFEEYIDDDEHIPTENDKIRLQFIQVTPHPAGPSSTIETTPERASATAPVKATNLASSEEASTSTRGAVVHTGHSTPKGVSGKLMNSHEAPVNIPQSQSAIDLIDDELQEKKATIFGKGGKKLNKYQQEINVAAAYLAKSDPSLLHNRGNLLRKARQHLHESGYEYARGKKSRSKVFGSVGSIGSVKQKTSVYSTESAREKRLDEIDEQVKSVETQLQFLDKAKDKAVTSSQFGEAASFEQQGANLKMKLRKLKFEKQEIEMKSKTLKSRKMRRKRNELGKGVVQTFTKKSKVVDVPQPDGENSYIEIMKQSNGEVIKVYKEIKVDVASNEETAIGFTEIY